MINLTQNQWYAMARYGLTMREMDEDGNAVCEWYHPAGVVDVYIHLDGSVWVEHGDPIDGYEIVPIENSFLAE